MSHSDRFSQHPIQVMLPTGGAAGAAAQPEPQPAPAAAPADANELPDGWECKPLAAPDAEGRTCYFVDHNTQTTHWKLPAPDYRPPEATKRDLFNIHVPAGCGPGSEVIASGFHVRVPPGVYAGQTFCVQFRPAEVEVPAGAYAGVTTNIWVHGLKGRVTIPAGFSPGQRFTIMAPSNTTEDNHQIHVDGAHWEVRHTADGAPYYVNHLTKQTQWDCPAELAVPGTAAPTPQPATVPPTVGAVRMPPGPGGAGAKAYFHIAPDRSRHPMSAQHNLEIATARARGEQAVRLSEVVLPDNTHLQFEIRFGAYGGPYAQRTGIMQLNTQNNNQREVEEEPVAAAGALPLAAPAAPAPALAAAAATVPAPPPPQAPAQAPAPPAPTPVVPATLDTEEVNLDHGAQLQAQMAGIKDEKEIKKLQKRNMILGELVKTEETYGATLEKIAQFYYEPMKARKVPGCTESDFKDIFGSFGSVLTFQRQLRKELKAQYDLLSSEDREHFSAQPTAEVLKKWAHCFKLYHPYLRDYETAMGCIHRLEGGDRQPDTPFKVWLKSSAQQSGADLPFLLIQPIQRIPRIVLLIAEIIKSTPDQLAEKQTLQQVHAMIEQQCNWINERVQLDDSRAKCGELHQQFRAKDLMEDKRAGDWRAFETIEGLPGYPDTGLMQPYRRLQLQTSASNLITGKEMSVLVFTDMVILAEMKTEFFTKRQYLRFFDKLDLNLDVAPSISTLRESAVDIVGKSIYRRDAESCKLDTQWSLQFEDTHKRDEFTQAVTECTSSAA